MLYHSKLPLPALLAAIILAFSSDLRELPHFKKYFWVSSFISLY
jgi:hypothetical protein